MTRLPRKLFPNAKSLLFHGVICFLIASLACQSLPRVADTLRVGMTHEQADKALHRKPSRLSQFGNVETAYYSDREGSQDVLRAVRFKDGRVINVEAENISAGGERTEGVRNGHQGLPPDLGQACEFNSDCTSKNCWLNKCAGPHNCLVTFGEACVFNTDCCDGICRGGICGDKE